LICTAEEILQIFVEAQQKARRHEWLGRGFRVVPRGESKNDYRRGVDGVLYALRAPKPPINPLPTAGELCVCKQGYWEWRFGCTRPSHVGQYTSVCKLPTRKPKAA
jgi:hypothetical protein